MTKLILISLLLYAFITIIGLERGINDIHTYIQNFAKTRLLGTGTGITIIKDRFYRSAAAGHFTVKLLFRNLPHNRYNKDSEPDLIRLGRSLVT